jgi:hypothetical protein
MFPLMGLLFTIAFVGMVCGLGLLIFRRTRFLAPFVFFPLVGAAFLSFCLFWSGGLLVEFLFGQTRWSTLAAFLGLAGGFIAGGFCGLFIAWRVARHIRRAPASGG